MKCKFLLKGRRSWKTWNGGILKSVAAFYGRHSTWSFICMFTNGRRLIHALLNVSWLRSLDLTSRVFAYLRAIIFFTSSSFIWTRPLSAECQLQQMLLMTSLHNWINGNAICQSSRSTKDDNHQMTFAGSWLNSNLPPATRPSAEFRGGPKLTRLIWLAMLVEAATVDR